MRAIIFVKNTDYHYDISMKMDFVIPGLSSREAAILDILAKSGPLNISNIADLAFLHRPAVYACIRSLRSKELIASHTKHKRILYSSRGEAPLKKWMHLWEQKMLRKMKGPAEPTSAIGSSQIQILQGKNISQLWEKILTTVPRGGIYYRYDAYPTTMSATTYMPKDFYECMEKKRIDRFVITNASLRNAFFKKKLACASHVLPVSIDPFEQGVTQFMFADTIAFVDFTKEVAFLIQNSAIADFQRQLFRAMYEKVNKATNKV